MLDIYSRRAQVQERLTNQVADLIMNEPRDLNAPTRSLIERWMATPPGQCAPTGGCEGGVAPPPGRAGALLLIPALREALMREALAEAQCGLDEGECPVGCVIALLEGGGAAPRMVGRGHNRVEALTRKTAHAEMLAFENTGEALDSAVSDIVLVTTLEPCVMCLGACFEVGVALVVFGLSAPADGGIGRITAPSSPDARTPVFQGDVLAAESRALFGEFVRRRGSTGAAYAEQLLSLTVRR